MVLSIKNLNKNFEGVAALNDFSLASEAGEVIGLIGPNGAGKTTLFNVISGYLVPTSGNIKYNGLELFGLEPHKIADLGVARTFQNLRLIGRLTVLENILLAFKKQIGESTWGSFFQTRKVKIQELAHKKKAMSLLQYLSISDKADDFAKDLSYGQQKLLSIACCLTADAKLILLDEPVAGINPKIIDKILAVISDQKANGKTIILIEHNLKVIKTVSDRIVVMDEGKKIAEGSYNEIKQDTKVIKAYLE